jgi:mRNA interferase RelE/StbE
LAWTIEWTDSARKQLTKLDRQVARQIVDYVETRAAPNPRGVGKALTARFASLWRYRVGDYRVIVSVEDALLRVLVVRVGHRREIYKK